MPARPTAPVLARPLWVIAEEIRSDPAYTPAVARYADSYVDALTYVTSITDPFGEDSALDAVRRLVCTTGGWRGETARRVKTELRGMLAGVHTA